MLNKDKIQEIVYRAIERTNELLLDENVIAKEPETILLGEGACLDSMGFVNFIAALEEELENETGANLNVAERLNTTNGKGRTVRSVGEMIEFLLAQGIMSTPGGKVG